MRMPSVKKILFVAFILILLIAIPLTIYLISQQKSKLTEVPTTTLSFIPAAQSVNQGDNLTIDVSMDPGKNSVSAVNLLIAYDPTKLATVEGGLIPNSTAFPSIIKGPTYGDGTIAITLAIGANSPAIQTTTKVATINFKALEATDTAPTQLTFNSQTNVISSNGTNQNVLSSAAPATVNIAAVTNTPTPFPTVVQSVTPTPTTSPNQNLTLNTTSTTGPVCISFTADRPTTGTVPFNVNFTLVATDSAAIISKATFNFGDGQTQDITSDNGLGINPYTVNALALHVYNTPGTFTATGSITDVNGNVSDIGTCSIVVNVSDQTQTSSQTATLTPAPSPLPPTGNNSFMTILAFGFILTIAGIFLLIAL